MKGKCPFYFQKQYIAHKSAAYHTQTPAGLHMINLSQLRALAQPEPPIVSALVHSLGAGRSELGQVNSDLKFPVPNKTRRLGQFGELQCLHHS